MGPIIDTQVEIAAPPEIVRAKFLDCASLQIYKPSLMQSITPQDPSKSPLDLVPGDRLDYVFSNGKVVCTVRENSPRRIAWTASLGYINGEHYWTFEPDSSSPGNTILHHGEEFGGPLAFLMGDNFIARMSGAKSWVEKSYNDFNKDFRKWIEEGEEGVRKAATTSL